MRGREAIAAGIRAHPREKESPASVLGMTVKPLVSIIIPTFNEAHQILSTLDAIKPNTTPNEVIVVDGGSSDGTAELARKESGRVLRAMKRNRAIQMNQGRRLAHGDVLLFLHADTLIAPVALEKIADAVRRRQVVGGAFSRRYASPSMFLRERRTCLRNFAEDIRSYLVIRRFLSGQKYSMLWAVSGNWRSLKTWIFPGGWGELDEW